MNTKSPLNRSTRYLKGLAIPLAAVIMMALPTTSFAGFYLSVNVAPPPLPYYEQPPIPGDGYIWTPGYWAYSDDGYFWVPGTWVLAPYQGALWTPGYWGYGDDGNYAFNAGYWGPHIGFYGGIDYGYGYGGIGYSGGYWQNGGFYYNRGINNFGSINITNIYNRTVINNFTINSTRTSFSGGTGGVMARPTREEMMANRERHTPPVAAQAQHVEAASHNSQLFASVNHGAPAIAATQKPGVFAGEGVVRAHPLRDEERAAAVRAEQAKPVGAPVNSVMEMNRRGPVNGQPQGRGPVNGPQPGGRGPVYGPQPQGRGPVNGPQPQGRGPVNGPQPQGRGPVSGPQPQGRGPVYGPQPQGRGPVYGPRPEGRGPVNGPQPQGRGPVNGPNPNQPQPRAMPPQRQPASPKKDEEKKQQ